MCFCYIYSREDSNRACNFSSMHSLASRPFFFFWCCLLCRVSCLAYFFLPLSPPPLLYVLYKGYIYIYI